MSDIISQVKLPNNSVYDFKDPNLEPDIEGLSYPELVYIFGEGVITPDLSFYEVGGTLQNVRNTANMYIVRSAGTYRIPLVYGNGVKNGGINTQAYTRQGSTYTADFVNHLGNTLTSPFIEANTGCTASSAGLLWQTGRGLITAVSLVSGTDCRYLQFDAASIPATNGVALLYVKDANGDIMWSWTIWLTTDDLTPEVITNYQGVEYQMMPEAIGTIWNADRTRAFNPHYQWGRKDPMCPPAAYNSATNMTLYDINGNTYTGFGNYGIADDADAGGTVRSVANAIKMPEKFFLEYNTTTYNWNNLGYFNNFWNAAETGSSTLADNQATAVKTIYDPSPANFMLPMGRAFTGFTTTGSNTSTASEFNVIGSWKNGWQFKKSSDDAVGTYFPASGCRYRASGALGYVSGYGYFWTGAPSSQAYARSLLFYSGYVFPLVYYSRALGFTVRSVRELN